MEHKTLEALAKVAQVTPLDRESARALRRQRLERFATLLDEHDGRIRLFSLIEYIPEQKRRMLRQDNSPLTIAYRDPEFRRQGLSSDRLGDAISFFDLTMDEAHHLLCDCHYFRAVTPGMVARRARFFARSMTLAEIWDKFRRAVTARF